MYEVVTILFAIGLAGFFFYLRRSEAGAVHAILLIYAAFIASLIYYATQVFQKSGVPVIQGWYLSSFVPVEALAFVLGIEFLVPRRVFNWSIGAVGICFLALIIYGTGFIAAPYYSGFTEHAPSGHLRAYHPHWADIVPISARLVRLHPWLPQMSAAILMAIVLIAGLAMLRSFVKEPAC
jgi:hypothetical protein